MLSRRLAWSLALAVIFAASAPNQPSAAPRLQRLVVIGDSLSDSGNAGRFSNGPVWVEQLAEAMGLPLAPSSRGGTNFAVGGARLDPASGPTALPAQLEALSSRHIPPSGTLYVVWGGGNDLIAAVGETNGTEAVTRAAGELRAILAQLVAAGATDILVPNLPDVGFTPAVRAYGAAAEARARMLSTAFRRASDMAVEAVARSAGQGIHLIRLDVWSLAERAVAEPEQAGFESVRMPCQQSPPCDRALFWDGVHPTTYAHGRLARAALGAIEADR